MAAAIPLNHDLDVGAYYNFDYFVFQDEMLDDGFASSPESIRNAKLLSSQDAWFPGTLRHPQAGYYPHHTFLLSAPFYGQPTRDFIAREMYNVKKHSCRPTVPVYRLKNLQQLKNPQQLKKKSLVK